MHSNRVKLLRLPHMHTPHVILKSTIIPKPATALKGHPKGVPLLKYLKFTVFDNQYNRVVNRISDSIKREFTQNGVKIYDVR